MTVCRIRESSWRGICNSSDLILILFAAKAFVTTDYTASEKQSTFWNPPKINCNLFILKLFANVGPRDGQVVRTLDCCCRFEPWPGTGCAQVALVDSAINEYIGCKLDGRKCSRERTGHRPHKPRPVKHEGANTSWPYGIYGSYLIYIYMQIYIPCCDQIVIDYLTFASTFLYRKYPDYCNPR